MSARLRLRRGTLVAVCALFALAVLTGRAQAGPAPEAPPHPPGGSLKPDPGPGTAKPAITTTPSSSRASSYVPSFQRAAVPAATVRSTSVHHTSTARTTPPQHRATQPKIDPPAQYPALPVGLRAVAGFNELRAAASSGGSALLLAAGLLLVLFVIGETTFLGLAGSRLGVARAPTRRRSSEEPYPIRRIQLRR